MRVLSLRDLSFLPDLAMDVTITQASQLLQLAHDVPFDVIVLNDDSEAMFTLLKALRKQDPFQSIVVLSSNPKIENAVRVMQLGAYDYLPEGGDVKNLADAIGRCAERGNIAREVVRLRSELNRVVGVTKMVGDSAPMKQLLALAERVAQSDATVLIVGESGTGKELLARTIHNFGPRSDKPFVAFDCSALSPSLLEAELFGHEKGAFTGAGRSRRGLFREAHGGTIFLDEIGDIAPEVQNKLLRVLQEREIKPVGGDRFVKVDVRVLAATNKDLRARVSSGKFREDLYWRLAVVPIQVPPLRERVDDIHQLAAFILAKKRGAAKTFAGSEIPYPGKISPTALARLTSYRWPGNIRELENVLSRAAILCDGDEIRGDDLDLVGLGPESEDPASQYQGKTLSEIVAGATASIERRVLFSSMQYHRGNIEAVASNLGLSRASVYNKLKRYDIATTTGK